jgi:hypothetical protein
MSTIIVGCPRCGDPEIDLVSAPPGSPHYRRRQCRTCGAFRGWEPRPAVDPDTMHVPPGIPEGSPLPRLRGSSRKQEAFAEATRASLLPAWARFWPPDVIQAVRAIDDATWWLANRGKRYDEVRFPAEWAKV